MRVMLIDDSEADLLYTRIVLERCGAGYRVLSFDSARAALDCLTRSDEPPADLILLDINMPGMNGFDLLEAWERAGSGAMRSAVVVMLSSSPDAADADRARRFACVRGYLTKPIDRDQALGLRDLARP